MPAWRSADWARVRSAGEASRGRWPSCNSRMPTPSAFVCARVVARSTSWNVYVSSPIRYGPAASARRKARPVAVALIEARNDRRVRCRSIRREPSRKGAGCTPAPAISEGHPQPDLDCPRRGHHTGRLPVPVVADVRAQEAELRVVEQVEEVRTDVEVVPLYQR